MKKNCLFGGDSCLGRITAIVTVLAAVLTLTSCAMTTAVDRAVSEIDRGIDVISNDSTKWQSTLKQVSEKLPADLQATIRNEMSSLVQRSIATVGQEFKCSADFLAKRAVQGLDRIKIMLIGGFPDPTEPSFCLVDPGKLDVNVPPDSRTTILVSGYDLDAKDIEGHLLRLSLFSDKTGNEVDLPEGRIGRTTHYAMLLNVAGADFEKQLREKDISKIRIKWKGNISALPEVVVIPREPKKQVVTVPLGELTLTPVHVRGDRDFDTDDDEPMSFHVIGESQSNGSEISVKAFMRACEDRPDWTTAESSDDKWQTAYTAPPNWRITAVHPIGKSEKWGLIADHAVHSESLPQGEVVTRFDVYGDRKGDDAGTHTRVKVFFNSATVHLEEIIP